MASQNPSPEVMEAVERVNILLNAKLRSTYEDMIIDLHRENVSLKNAQTKLRL